ncbi:hypothetical protein H8I91_24865 [Serratia fonticola]|uniref:YebO family protein n=1 Tax=Serratia fonticola TaxID=47917 RepID=UPI0016471306|nr:YebO family protein [Serratia fonticola]MBC3253501.1 hypothetical protein [Serratia fonticola]
MEQAFFIWYLIFLFIGIVIWYFLNRASVRANKQIELLTSIDNKLSKMLDPNFEVSKMDNSTEGYLEEARKKAGL